MNSVCYWGQAISSVFHTVHSIRCSYDNTLKFNSFSSQVQPRFFDFLCTSIKVCNITPAKTTVKLLNTHNIRLNKQSKQTRKMNRREMPIKELSGHALTIHDDTVTRYKEVDC